MVHGRNADRPSGIAFTGVEGIVSPVIEIDVGGTEVCFNFGAKLFVY
jgi:hypothetical protein